MRRVVGGVLLALGSFLLVAALLLPTYAEARLVKIPLDQFSETVAEADGATIVIPPTFEEKDGVKLVATRRVKADTKNSSEKRVVFDVFVRVEDADRVVTDPKLRVITASRDRVALDRRTSEAVTCCNERIDGTDVEHKGLTYKFPFGTEKKTYQYFDNTAKAAGPIRYVGSEQLEGQEVYKFEMNVEPVKIGELPLGKLIGSTETNAPRFYTNTRTIWVEPVSGVIVKGREEQLHTLRNEAGEDKLTLVKADLIWNDATIKKQSDTAKDSKDRIGLVTRVLPLTLGVLGGVLVVFGLVLLVAGRSAGKRRA